MNLSAPKILRCLKWMLIISIFQLMIHFLLDIDYFNLWGRNNDYSKLERLWFYAPMIITTTFLWIGIGYVFEVRKKALVALSLSLLFIALELFVFKSPFLGFVSIAELLAKASIRSLPFLVFGFLLFGNTSKAWVIGLFAYVLGGITLIGSGGSVFDDFLRMFDIDSPMRWNVPTEGVGNRSVIFYPLVTFAKLFILPVLFMVFTQMVIQLKTEHSYMNGKWIDLSNTFSKKWATVIYITFHVTLLFLILGAVQYFRSFNINAKALQVYSIIIGLGVLVTIYMIAITYRKFVIEFLFSRGERPGWQYLFWHMPLVGIIVWFISMFKFGDSIPIAKRQELFITAQKKSDSSIKNFLIILQIVITALLLLLTTLTGFGTANLSGNIWLSAILSFTILIYYLESSTGVWVIIGLSVVLLFLNIYIDDFGGRNGFTTFFAHYSNAIILFALFHLSYFKDIHMLEYPSQNKEIAMEEE